MPGIAGVVEQSRLGQVLEKGPGALRTAEAFAVAVLFLWIPSKRFHKADA